MNSQEEHVESESWLPRNCGAKTRRIDLGLAVFSAVAPPGATFSAEEIACWCDCSPSMIASIEARALRRLRKKVMAQFAASPLDLKEFPFLVRHVKS